MVLVFDVETNGLLPKKKTGLSMSDYPHILQLSFVIYDLFERIVVQSYDTYIAVSDDVAISEKITELTGITREICKEKGCDIITALDRLYQAYIICNGVVAHNIEFDTTMVGVEMERNRTQVLRHAPHCTVLFNKVFESVNNIEHYCTMKKGVKDMKSAAAEADGVGVAAPTIPAPILHTESDGTVGQSASIDVVSYDIKKFTRWPRLAVLYNTLFNKDTPPNLHNSMVDVMVCLRCYVKMRHNIDIPDSTFSQMLFSATSL
jgi:DNA polymerase III epsilon subunit-like protein